MRIYHFVIENVNKWKEVKPISCSFDLLEENGFSSLESEKFPLQRSDDRFEEKKIINWLFI